MGIGNTSYDESRNGLLVLDECGTWFNSRSWGDKDRQPVIDWFLHARKLGWDIIFLIQDISIMDKQARLALAEHVVYCRRSDKLNIPFVGSIMNLVSGAIFFTKGTLWHCQIW
ncbi:zonular occludens toxin domain-containing protein [Escherichia coli]|uniref:zonular occludens toxin domain-containing protein n=2 Tax=Escherichia coli TaxID=562 RepID=UPI003D2FCCB0